MTITQLQQWVADDWEERSQHQPEVGMQLLYVVEELGEVAEAVRKNNGMKDRHKGTVDLGSEIADLIIATVTLANHFNVDLQRELLEFQRRLLQRHRDGY